MLNIKPNCYFKQGYPVPTVYVNDILLSNTVYEHMRHQPSVSSSLTSFLSFRLVTMTIVAVFCSQIIRQ